MGDRVRAIFIDGGSSAPPVRNDCVLHMVLMERAVLTVLSRAEPASESKTSLKVTRRFMTESTESFGPSPARLHCDLGR